MQETKGFADITVHLGSIIVKTKFLIKKKSNLLFITLPSAGCLITTNVLQSRNNFRGYKSISMQSGQST